MSAPIKPLDLLDAESLLSDEERAIRDTVRAYVERDIKPHIADWFESG